MGIKGFNRGWKTIPGENERGEKVDSPAPSWFCSTLFFAGKCLRFDCLFRNKECGKCYNFSKYRSRDG